MNKKSEEMHLVRAEVAENIKDVVENEILYPSEKFSSCPSFS
jgi:hypothetical protein